MKCNKCRTYMIQIRSNGVVSEFECTECGYKEVIEYAE
jgi:DNA-directed RNA polymerase subunit M/transcription elongation factor TFIIS